MCSAATPELVVLVERGQQPQADGGDRGARDRPRLVAARARDHLAREDRGEQQAAHHRQQLQPGGGRREPAHDLLEQRQVGQRAEQREADDQADRARDHEHAVLEQRGGQDRLLGAILDEPERDEARDPDHAHRHDRRRRPLVGVPAQRGQQDDRAQPERQQQRARVVDLVRAPLAHRRQRDAEHDQRADADRQVDVEDRAPRDARREEAAEQWAGDARDAEHRAEQPRVLAALGRRDDVPDRRLRAHHQPTAAESLNGAKRDQ